MAEMTASPPGHVYYPGGLSRGDTPPREIRTIGAAGFLPKQAGQAVASSCPFYVDETMPFSARSTGMSLDVVRKEDVPAGPRVFPKDYQRSLITHDLPRAVPTLAHPTTGAAMPVPWKFLEKPEQPEIELSRAQTHYPAVRESRRPRDLSLKAYDIEHGQPRKHTINSEGRARSDAVVDPLVPSYQFASSMAFPVPDVKSSGRCTLDISDIEGTRPRPRIPMREESQYGDPMKCEAEFRAAGRDLAHAEAVARAEGRPMPGPPPRAPPRPISGGRKARPRDGDALEPRYAVAVASEAGTSLHCRWSEERQTMGDEKPPAESQEIGPVQGGKPRSKIRDNGQPFLSLETRDVEGATTLHKVAGLPYTIYGPPGNRPLQSACLHTGDIEGAQASTLPKGPRVPARHSRLANAGLAGVASGAATPRGGPSGQAPPAVARIPAERG